jgi:protein-disulfide isomerase
MKIMDEDHVRGPNDAAITIVEYGDFECPHTRAAEETVRLLLEENPDVRLVFRHFPLAHLHPHAEALAAMAEAAQDFWAVHDRLLRDAIPDDVSAPADAAARDRVERNVDEGRRLGVESTPTFFFDDEKHDGSYNHATLSQKLQEARARSK